MATIIVLGDSLKSSFREIVKGIALCKTNKQLGEELGFSETTIGTYRREIYAIINCNCAVQAALFALQSLIITMDEAMDFWYSIENNKVRNHQLR